MGPPIGRLVALMLSPSSWIRLYRGDPFGYQASCGVTFLPYLASRQPNSGVRVRPESTPGNDEKEDLYEDSDCIRTGLAGASLIFHDRGGSEHLCRVGGARASAGTCTRAGPCARRTKAGRTQAEAARRGPQDARRPARGGPAAADATARVASTIPGRSGRNAAAHLFALGQILR